MLYSQQQRCSQSFVDKIGNTRIGYLDLFCQPMSNRWLLADSINETLTNLFYIIFGGMENAL